MLRYSLQQLRYFLTVAECGTVAGAARELNVSQPSISTAIQKLESQLQIQLFLRHPALGVSLTRQGEELLIEARSLIAHAEDFQRHAASETVVPLNGNLHLGSFITLAPAFLPSLITSFHAQYDNARIVLAEDTQNGLITGLRSGTFEQALLYDVDLPDDLLVLPLASFAPYVLLSADHHLALRDKVSLRDLATEPLVLLDVEPSRQYFTGLLQSQGITPNVSFASPSLEMVRGMVARGAGFSLLVTRPASPLSYDGLPLAECSLADDCAPGRICLVQLKSMRATRLMAAFSAHTRSCFAAMPDNILAY